MLAIPANYDFSSGRLPSPADLEGKVLLKVYVVKRKVLTLKREKHWSQLPFLVVMRETNARIQLQM